MNSKRPVTVKVRICVAWWLGCYLVGVTAMCRLTGAEPDWDKVGRVAERAVRLKVGGMTDWELSLRLVLSRVRRKAHLMLARCATAMHPWIHTPDDGRGMRAVYLDGQKVDQVVYANTRRGIVRMYHNPIRINRKREVVRTYKRTGKVEVVRLSERVSV